ncbi:EAL domain-containing protein [Ferrimonas gelatinilytica]|uniref:EAL domain-containing protein n=1 Tax=Ferrimonas gelatinilytica TaxID=1255257 RepID=A0ABP9S5G9_9GAMM
MRRWIALLWLSLLPWTLLAEEDTGVKLKQIHKFQQYGLKENLSEGTVTSIAQDKLGFIWVGTINGLNRFDGYEFEQFKSDNAAKHGITENLIVDLITYNDVLWLITNRNVYKHDTENNNFVKMLSQPHLVWGGGIVGGKLNFFSDKGTYIYQSETLILSERSSYTDTIGYKLHDVSNGKHYIRSSFNGDAIINYGMFNIDNLENIGIINKTLTVEGGTVLGTTKGLFAIKDGISKQPFRVGTIKDIVDMERTEDYIYIASSDGIYKVSVNNIDNESEISSLTSEPSNSVFIDENENLWFGTIGSGVMTKSLETGEIVTYNLSTELNSSNQVWSLSKLEEKIVIGTSSPELFIANKNFSIEEKITTRITGPKSITNALGDIVVGGSGGVYLLEREKNKSWTEKKILEHTATSFTKNKDSIFIGTFSNGLYVFEKYESIKQFELIPKLSSPIFHSLKNDGKLFVGAQSGLHIYRRNKESNNEVSWYLEKKLFDETIVSSIAITKNGLLVGTVSSGLYLIDENSDYKRLELLKNTSIYGISRTENNIYVTSSNKIYLLDNETLELIKVYSVIDGGQPEYTGMASTIDGNTLYFGGSLGVSLINEPDTKRSEYISPPVITSVKVFNESLPFFNPYKANDSEAVITLKHSDYPFSFSFSSLLNASHMTTLYEYRLSGFNETWIPTNSNHRLATYTNIPSGKYIFQVRTRSPHGNYHSSPISISIEILPPWWFSEKAKAVYFSILLLIAFVLYKESQRRKFIQHKIAQSEERLKLSLWGSGDEMWDWDIKAGKIYRSNMWESLDFASSRSQSGGKNIHPHDKDRVGSLLKAHFDGKSDHFEATYRVRGKNRDWVWILDRAKIVEWDQDDKPIRMTGTIKDINKIKETEERLSLFARALTNISEGMLILGSTREIIEVNKAFLTITGFDKEYLINSEMELNEYPKSHLNDIFSIVNTHGRWKGELDFRKKNGSLIQIELTIDRLNDLQGHECFYVGVITDITHRKLAEAELRRLTNTDTLTGLPNRSYLQVSIDKLLRLKTPFSLTLFDLDNFKRINDSLGHEIGDNLLCHIANRLQGRVPQEATLHRLGGDEFAIIYEGKAAVSTSSFVAQTVLDVFKQPFTLAKQEILLNCSIGVATYPEDDDQRQSLIRKADLAMYHAKSQGGHRYQYYNEALNLAALSRLEMEGLIRQALKEDWFEVYYQAKVANGSHHIIGAEALVRLNHPERGLISPMEFIPLAEESQLIIEIGEVVMRKACFAAQNWRQKDLFKGHIAVNLSSKQFALTDLVDRVQRVLSVTQLPGNSLELEITEGSVIRQPEKAVEAMMSLKQLGIRIALDDFGTGYSSLSYLKSFPIDTLKIDKSFIDDLVNSHSDRMMVSSLITIAKNLDLNVVAEGVECLEQAEALDKLGCETMQGFFFSKPVSEKTFEQVLIEAKTHEEEKVKKRSRQETV